MPPSLSSFLISVGGALLITFIVILGIALRHLVQTGRTQKIPSVSVSLGVAFTFVGIFIALLGFDVQNVQDSIPKLLDGMRLAFATSIAGIFVAVLHRIAPNLRLWTPTEAGESDDGVTTIERLNTAQLRRHEAQVEHLQKVEEALAGEGDTTLLTQLQKLRTSFVDKQNELIEVFETFSEKLAEDQTEALIDALEGVIRDFNAKINEQFGENFKQLNEGVERLVTWQEEHKEHVETMTDRLDSALESIEQSEQALARIADHSERFDASAERLDDVLTAFKNEIDALEQHLEDFADVGDRAKDALPAIQENLESTTETYQTAIENARKEIEESARQQQESISDVMETMRQEQNRLQGTIEETSEQTAENIANQIEALDEELGEELNKALSSLGSQLTSLSEKFVEDYEPLTRELQELVQLSRKVQQENGA